MKHRIAFTAIATAAALGVTGAFLVPAASAKTVTHTLTFTSVTEATVTYSPALVSQQDKDVNKAGKAVGYDLLYIAFNAKTGVGKLNFTGVENGGFVYGVGTVTSSPTIHGTVTGGTGIFKGATGTLLAKNLNKAGTRTAVTITYRT